MRPAARMTAHMEVGWSVGPMTGPVLADAAEGSRWTGPYPVSPALVS